MNTIEQKKEAYKNLVERIIQEKKKFTGENKFKGKKLSFEWCSFCRQINLWTYWQGLGCYNPKILLVGQDFGYSNDLRVKVGIETENKKDHYAVFDKKDAVVHYFDGADDCEIDPTDRNLCELFSFLGYDDIQHQKYEDLFFTNISLMYRSDPKISGGFVKKDCDEFDLDVFKELVDILEPTVIICLGKITSELVMKALGLKSPIKKFKDLFINNPHQELIYQKGNKKIAVFPEYHCGSLGVMNRNRIEGKNYNTDKTGLSLIEEDWSVIKKYLEAHSK
ncbi:hypothetical protein [Succinivibrio dextrinosolvens]|uniref:hypothetical protein n=1 Tax=Succinivibrio dextrinosolvens TaxID=83771 RepID=UPI00241FD809|nr:hypothetical protein [Succinivibrio dextrinosolvens]MBE6423644.1 hypothetical protein [Succinivibrio dextrinosolvens]